MKLAIFISFLLVTVQQTSAQETTFPYADRNTGTLYLSAEEKFKEGETLTLGKGTAPSGDFIYITKTLGKIPLSKEAAGKKVEIQRIRWVGTSKKGYVFYLVLRKGDELDNYYDIEIKNAIASGEVVSRDPNYKKPSSSVADELTKLKNLKDQGVLTAEEFETLKKKILAQ